MGRPTIYPTGATVYDPEKCQNGYTVLSIAPMGIIMLDMNGRVVRRWKDMFGLPARVLPGGHMIASKASRPAENGYQDQEDLTMVDMDGNVEWTFDHNQLINDPDGERWMARQHHDYQITGNPVGYWTPGQDPDPDSSFYSCRRGMLMADLQRVWLNQYRLYRLT